MTSRYPRGRVIFSIIALCSSSLAFGQPRGGAPALQNEVSFSYDASTSGDAQRGLSRGEVAIDTFEIGYQYRRRLASGAALQIGLELAQHEIDSTGLALPSDLSAVSLPIGFRTAINADWMLNTRFVPAIAGDDGPGSGAFTLLGVIIGTRQVTPAFAWSFGVIGRTHADNPVIPILGLNWNFAPDWSLIIGAPRTGIRHRLNENLEWGLGASIRGGTFHIDAAPGPGLGDTYLDFREIRVGVDIKYSLASTFTLQFEAGAVTDRRFDYYDRGFEYNGDSAAYARIGLSFEF
jgi:hypothetical protein